MQLKKIELERKWGSPNLSFILLSSSNTPSHTQNNDKHNRSHIKLYSTHLLLLWSQYHYPNTVDLNQENGHETITVSSVTLAHHLGITLPDMHKHHIFGQFTSCDRSNRYNFYPSAISLPNLFWKKRQHYLYLYNKYFLVAHFKMWDSGL